MLPSRTATRSTILPSNRFERRESVRIGNLDIVDLDALLLRNERAHLLLHLFRVPDPVRYKVLA